MERSPSLRDRRSLNLSISSIGSSNSTVAELCRTSTNEKQSSSLQSLDPALPMFVTKENQSRPKNSSKAALAIRIFIAICSIIFMRYIVFDWLTRPLGFRSYNEDISYTKDGFPDDYDLPDEPSVVTFSDNHGHSRWTVHIPRNYSFPLRNRDSQEICRKVDALQERVNPKYRQRARSYYSTDATFVDTDEVENAGDLPQLRDQNNGKVCEKSLTFVLEDDDAAFGRSLLMMWLSYGLAKQEGRAFFVDDTRWAYGKYESYFAPPPFQGCAQPPLHRMLPCPHSAKHLLVSSATLQWTFGSSFEQEFIDWKKKGLEKSHRIYDLLRRGYKDLFHLTGEHALYAASRIAKFREEADQHNGAVIGIHIRRGDLHPFEQQFSQDYIQLERYGDPARNLIHSQLQISNADTREAFDDFQTIVEPYGSPLILATDDPELFDSEELMQSAAPLAISKAQELIPLATKSTLDMNLPAESHSQLDTGFTTFVDENTGWEGGFYEALFFSLGTTERRREDTVRSGSKEDARDEVSLEQARRLRELVGKAYILDIAVLGQSDSIICAISSATCRLLGVMLGLDALREGKWINVDDNRDGNRVWTWDGRR